uniref:Uncharacterized protein n=1 Tax=Solanum tuberosum TaxID=4113 RepID=M0ZMA0_SOLTU
MSRLVKGFQSGLSRSWITPKSKHDHTIWGLKLKFFHMVLEITFVSLSLHPNQVTHARRC